MTHSQLVSSVLGIHAAVLIGAIGAFYRYGDRSTLFAASLAGVDATIRRIRRQIADALATHLSPVFESPGSDPSPIITSNGGSYSERRVNPVGSESYRESIRDFLEGDNAAIADYRLLIAAKTSWCFWARCRGWLILMLLLWQALAVTLLGAIDKIFGVAVTDWLVKWPVGPTALMVIGFVLMSGAVMRQDDRILRIKERYDVP